MFSVSHSKCRPSRSYATYFKSVVIEKHSTPNEMLYLNSLSHFHSYWPSWDIWHQYLQKYSFLQYVGIGMGPFVLIVETNTEAPQSITWYRQKDKAISDIHHSKIRDAGRSILHIKNKQMIFACLHKVSFSNITRCSWKE